MKFELKETILAFDDVAWSKTGDLPEGNDVYFKPAIILKFREVEAGFVADVEFINGRISNGHFIHALKKL